MHIFLFAFIALSEADPHYEYRKTLKSFCDYSDSSSPLKWVKKPKENVSDQDDEPYHSTFEQCQESCDIWEDCRGFAHLDPELMHGISDETYAGGCWIIYENGPYKEASGNIPDDHDPRFCRNPACSCNEKIYVPAVDPPALPATFVGKGYCKPGYASSRSASGSPLFDFKKYMQGGSKESCAKKCARDSEYLGGCLGYSVKYDEYRVDNCVNYFGKALDIIIDGGNEDDEGRECYTVCRPGEACNYNFMDGSCATPDGTHASYYMWKPEVYNDLEPEFMQEWLTDEECRAVCSESDICIGYENSNKPNSQGVCKIMIERTEYTGDTSLTPISADQKCVQKKVFDKNLPDFAKVGEGKCTIGGVEPKGKLLNASKKECKLQCETFDNCHGYNFYEDDQKRDCYLWLEGPIDGTDKKKEDYGNCKMKVPVNLRQTVAVADASRHYIIVGGVGIGLMSAAAVFAWNIKKGGQSEELETLI